MRSHTLRCDRCPRGDESAWGISPEGCFAVKSSRKSDHPSMRDDMDSIERRELMKAATVGGVALSIFGTQNLLLSNATQAQGANVATWPNRRLIDLLKIPHPIIQAPMGGHITPNMPAAVCEAGGLGSFPCAGLNPTQLRDLVATIRAKTSKPLNLNFFSPVRQRDEAIETAWLKRLPYKNAEYNVAHPKMPVRTGRTFSAERCNVLVELRPAVVSFHAALPEESLIDRLKAAGCVIFGSATTVAEARWLVEHGGCA